jgi:hypothetical protein
MEKYLTDTITRPELEKRMLEGIVTATEKTSKKKSTEEEE